MKLDRKLLLEALQLARPALSKKEFLEEAIRFIFNPHEIATFNDQLCILIPFETGLKFSANGNELYKILDGIKEDEVEITVEDEQVKINSKKTKAGLSTIVGEKERVDTLISRIRDVTNAKGFWRRLPKNFIEGVSLCMFSASRDMTTGAYCCVAAKDNKIYSTDKLRISRFVMDGEVKELLIPARDAIELVKYPVTKYGKSGEWIHFMTNDNVMFNCRTMIGEYPYNLDRFFIPIENSIAIPEELQDAMKNAAIMAAGDVDIAKMVEMRIEPGKITCKSEKERGWLIKEVDFDGYEGDPIIFYINPIFFAQILTKTTSIWLRQNEQEPPDKGVFTRDNFTHIIALGKED